MSRCLKCSKQNREGARFCEECGARITNPTTLVSTAQGAASTAIGCPVCSLQNAPNMNFCRRCGGRLPKPDPRSTLQMSGPVPTTAAPAENGKPPPVAVLMPAQQAGPAASPKRPCPSCGGLTPLGFSFCQNCGTHMGAEPGTPPASPPPIPKSAASAAAPAGGAAARRPETPRPVTPGVSRPTPIGVPATAPPPAPSAAAPAVARVRLVAIQRDGADGEVHEVSAEKVALGRREGQVVFDKDPYLADRHAVIERRGSRWVLVDLGSRNGTFVRTKGPVNLRRQEVLLAGKQVLALELLPSDQPETQPAEEQGVLVFGTPVATAWGRLRQLTMSGVARDVYHLTRPEIALGREDGDILFPEDEFMSRCHVVLQQRDGAATVVDQGSSNGTYLRIRGEHEIVGGDHIRLGDQLLRFEVA